jgi:hypothetical protein
MRQFAVRIDQYTELQFYLLFGMGVKLGSLTLRFSHRLRVLKDRVLWEIFGSKRDEVGRIVAKALR